MDVLLCEDAIFGKKTFVKIDKKGTAHAVPLKSNV